jgi:hypothetical protein
MPRTPSHRWTVVVFDADGDMGYGNAVGPFRDPVAAARRAQSIQTDADRRGINATVLVLRLLPGQANLDTVLGDI